MNTCKDCRKLIVKAMHAYCRDGNLTHIEADTDYCSRFVGADTMLPTALEVAEARLDEARREYCEPAIKYWSAYIDGVHGAYQERGERI